MNSRYNQILAQIEAAQDEQDLDAARAAVFAYKAQKGGVNVELQSKVNALINKINIKLKELNRYL